MTEASCAHLGYWSSGLIAVGMVLVACGRTPASREGEIESPVGTPSARATLAASETVAVTPIVLEESQELIENQRQPEATPTLLPAPASFEMAEGVTIFRETGRDKSFAVLDPLVVCDEREESWLAAFRGEDQRLVPLVMGGAKRLSEAMHGRVAVILEGYPLGFPIVIVAPTRWRLWTCTL